MSILTVGAGQQFAHLADAIAASHDGDTIDVQAGTYTNDFATINTKISIVGVGGMVNLVASGNIPNGKAILITNTDVTLDHIAFSGATVADANGAGIRYQGGNLVIKNSYFHDNQDGLLAAPVANGTITIDHSEFAHNGTGTGSTHNLYVNEIASLTITNSYFHDAVVGHEIKSRADNTIIENSRIFDGPNGTASYSVDLPDGGNATIANNVIEQGPHTQNPAIIHLGGESPIYANTSLSVTNNVILNDDPASSAVGVFNQTSFTPSITNNEIFGLTSSHIASGPSSQSGNTFLTTEPTLDTSSPWQTSPSGPVITTPDAIATPSEARHYVLPDRSGVANGPASPSVIRATGDHQTLIGNGGDDIFQLDGHGDAQVTENGHGTSTVLVSATSYTLASTVNDLTGNSTGAQTLTGNALANYITLGNGNNILDAGAGNDTIAVGTGANTLTGGTGQDLFKFNALADHGNVISDFTLGQDELDLTGLMKSLGYKGTDPVADHTIDLVQSGNATNVVVDPHHNGDAASHVVVTLNNILPSSLTEGHDFIWHA